MDWTAIIVGVLGVLATIWQARGKAQYAAVTKSVIKGVEAYSTSGGDIKATIRTVAASEGTQEVLHALVKKVTK